MEYKRIIEVVPYDPAWVTEYESEKIRIAEILANENIRIHHIGSTAVPGLASKPTIDIMIEIDKIETIELYNRQFEELDYIPRGELGIEGRRLFVKKHHEIHSHHIHAYQQNTYNVKRHLAFVRLLNENTEIREEYERIKLEAVAKFAEEPEKYLEYKSAFIQEMEQYALDLYYPEKN